MSNPFRYFNSSPEIIRLVMMMYVRYPLSLRNVADLLAERGIEISHETVRFWWNRFGPMFAAERKSGQRLEYHSLPDSQTFDFGRPTVIVAKNSASEPLAYARVLWTTHLRCNLRRLCGRRVGPPWRGSRNIPGVFRDFQRRFREFEAFMFSCAPKASFERGDKDRFFSIS
jgi:hypothetical protein